jgi:Lanthionine-containing peptide SapB precursor RamS
MTLLDLQGLRVQDFVIGFESEISVDCNPASNISLAGCDDDPTPSQVSALLCVGL